MQQVIEILQIASVTLLVLTCLLLLRYRQQGMRVWIGIGFALSVACYLIVETEFIQQSIMCPIVLTGAICVPVFFWLMSKAIFDDHFRLSPITALYFIVQITVHLQFYQVDFLKTEKTITDFSSILAQVASIGFVLAALYVALQTRKGDLIDSRLHFRNIFVFVTAALIGITLIVELTKITVEAERLLQLLQRASILGLSTFFLFNNLHVQPGFFFREIPKHKRPTSHDPDLENKLMTLFKEEKIYRKEGLTIKELADTMNVQEHRLRRLINGQLEFKNFNDFLNQYRVNEACEILSDSTQNQKTILEIAYGLGYQSIGPFNKAFKEQKNTTPTAFRKTQSH